MGIEEECNESNVLPPPLSPKKVRRDEPQAWRFNRGMWEEVEEIIYHSLKEDDDTPTDEIFSKAGWTENPILTLGSLAGKQLFVEVQAPRLGVGSIQPPYPYHIEILIGLGIEIVYAVDFPSLVMLLSQLGSIVKNVEL